MSYFLKSHRNGLVIAFFAFFLLAFILQLGLSYIFSSYAPALIQNLTSAFDHKVKIETVNFSLLKGVRLGGISVFYGNQPQASVMVDEAYVSAKFLPLLFKTIVVDRIKINKAVLLSKKEKGGVNLQIIFSDIYKQLSEAKPIISFKTNTDNVCIDIKEARIIPAVSYQKPRKVSLLYKNARLSTHNATEVKFKSNIICEYQIRKELFISRFFNNPEIIQNGVCSMQGTIKNKDLKIDLFILNLNEQQIIVTGTFADFAERNPRLELSSIPGSLSLQKIDFLKNNFDAVGDIFLSLNISGFLDNPIIFSRGHLDNCDFTYRMADGEIINIRNATGNIEYKNDAALLQNMNLKFNNLPIKLNLKTTVSLTPDINFSCALIPDFLAARGLPIEKLEAIFKGKIQNTLQGDLEIKTLYKRKGSPLELQANFGGVDFDYYNMKKKLFRAKKIELRKYGSAGTQKLNFYDLDSNVKLTRDLFYIKDAKLNAYGGTLTGAINIDFAKRKPQLNLFLRGGGLDVKTLMQDIRVSGKLLSGIMDLSVKFDNNAERFVEGRCYIKDGVIDLGTLSQAVKFPPLNNTNFDMMHIYFAIFKDYIAVRAAKLSSPKIKLNGFWDTNGKVSGVLNLNVSSDFLRQSSDFKRLLDFTRIKTPYISFKFLLGGIPQAIRFMWMKGEFKNKLEEKLPRGIQSSIEASLNKNIDELSNR